MTIWELIALAKSGGASSVFHFKGSVLNESSLPDSGEDGDVYLVDSADSYYAWDGEGWTDIGQLLTADEAREIIADLSDEVGDLKSAVNNPVTGLDGKAPIIINSASGIVARFDDGADGLPLKKLSVQIAPVQSGSGDPSPTNLRPLSGWTAIKIGVYGKNLFGGSYNTTFAFPLPLPGREGSRFVGSATPVAGNPRLNLYSPSGSRFWNGGMNSTTATGRKYRDFYSQSFQIAEAKFDVATCTEMMIELGSVPSAYTPYIEPTIATFTLPAAGTVYAGTLTINDDGTGELRSRPEYAAYNGETLVGPWISDRDVYAAGTTPTIGAQVVDMGGEETVYQLTGQQVINTLYGVNTIWADCGDVKVEYRADTTLYIDNKLAELQALVLENIGG